MLTELRIRDFAIIDELQLQFEPGFSVLTGETGAGKSIIIDAMELVLGGRADSTVVRSGANRAIVEATFRLGHERRQSVDTVLKREGLEGDDPQFLSLGREIRLNGRNVSRINGRSVTLALVREVIQGLVEIHGQSEHLSLLQVHEHINLLDRFTDLQSLRAKVEKLAKRVRSVRQELEDLLHNEQALAHRADLLQFQIGEIEKADLYPDEEEELLEERVRLANSEQLMELIGEALLMLDSGDREAPAALDLVGIAVRTLESLTRVDSMLEPQLAMAENVNYQLEELARALRDYQEQIEHNPRRLRQVEDRLSLIRRLERKYGSSVAEVLTYAEEAKRELNAISHSEERIVELEIEESQLLDELGQLAVELSHKRRKGGQRLAAAVEEELRDLRMEGARFGIDFQWREDETGVPLAPPVSNLHFRASSSGVEQLKARDSDIGDRPRVTFNSSGIDHVEFLISPNPGEPLKPITKIASGGETSRLMLALKTVLSRADETTTLIFDEIDQGIGGRVGTTVGEKLWGLAVRTEEDAPRRQVLCVTHLPQLAGFGDTHLRVEKHIEATETGERTVTRIYRLKGEDRVKELGQMLGGSGDAAYRSAKEILDYVEQHKSTLAST